ncbi:lengsin, lens protein with glutamine synthetase domain [Phyllostomus discolor]|uniref:Lengsin, lens protein with glutamine synthetase domain n=1 Tax=Phyllostomus discolor TaxID=89673 RepID=A0A834ANP2_9CHIR|nr:lengsin, lens protein with glutamine synthetase domain [Phyllostomus discolor]
MNNEGDLLEEDARDEGNEMEGSRMTKLRRTRKKVTKSQISSTEIGEMDISNSKEKIKKQMVCHKVGDMSKPVVGHGSAESHLPQDDKDFQDHVTVIKPLPLETSAGTPGGEFNPDSSYTE